MYIIKKIISICEKSKNAWTYGKTGHRNFEVDQKDYNFCGRSEFLEEARELEKEGLIDVKWYSLGSEILTIGFRLEKLDLFYEMENMIPKWKRVSDMETRIQNELNHITKGWIRDYYQDLLESLSPENTRKFPKESIGYFEVFRGLDQLNGPVYKRIFSKKFLHDSKIFEKKKQSYVITIAKEFCPDVVEEMSDTEILSQIFIEEYSQQMEVKGPLRISLKKDDKESILDLGEYFYGTILNSETLKQAEVLPDQPKLKRIVTIENKANFVSMPYREDTLYIFTHGYFTPKERTLLLKLDEVLKDREDIRFYHTGDMDYGGIKIFEYIEAKIFNRLEPLNMDVDTYMKYLDSGGKMKDDTVKKLKECKVEKLEQLISLMIEKKIWIEQEIFLNDN